MHSVVHLEISTYFCGLPKKKVRYAYGCMYLLLNMNICVSLMHRHC